MAAKNTHDSRLFRLSREITDVIKELERPFLIAIDSDLSTDNRCVGRPDLFIYKRGDIYLVEYKCNDKREEIIRLAKNQLTKHYNFIRDNLDYESISLHLVYGLPFKHERIK